MKNVFSVNNYNKEATLSQGEPRNAFWRHLEEIDTKNVFSIISYLVLVTNEISVIFAHTALSNTTEDKVRQHGGETTHAAQSHRWLVSHDASSVRQPPVSCERLSAQLGLCTQIDRLQCKHVKMSIFVRHSIKFE